MGAGCVCECARVCAHTLTRTHITVTDDLLKSFQSCSVVATTTNALLAFLWPCDRGFDVSRRQSLRLSPHSQRPVRTWWMLVPAAAGAAAAAGLPPPLPGCCRRAPAAAPAAAARGCEHGLLNPALPPREVIRFLRAQTGVL